MGSIKLWFSDLVAAVSFFTRLPLYRLIQVDGSSYGRVLPFAIPAGWIVGFASAGAWWSVSQVLPISLSAIVVIAFAVLLTGALHEDGFADFADGFGGGHTKESILAIMKDSHIGTYGVIALVMLFGMRFSLLTSCPPQKVWLLLVGGAAVGRYVGVLLPNMLPYARTIETSKIQVGLVPMSYLQLSISSLLVGITSYLTFGVLGLYALMLAMMLLPTLSSYIKRKIGGYTGDCCGMLIVAAELLWGMVVVALC